MICTGAGALSKHYIILLLKEEHRTLRNVFIQYRLLTVTGRVVFSLKSYGYATTYDNGIDPRH